MATISPLPTSSFHIPDPVRGCLTGMGSGLCSPAVSRSMVPAGPTRPGQQLLPARQADNVLAGGPGPGPSIPQQHRKTEHGRGATVSPSEPTAQAL